MEKIKNKGKSIVLAGVFWMIFAVGVMAMYTCSNGMAGSHPAHSDFSECHIAHTADIAINGGHCDYTSSGFVYYPAGGGWPP